LRTEGWEYLQPFLLCIKKKQIESCDPKLLDADLRPPAGLLNIHFISIIA
jgi:hypothetical protein